MKTLNDERIQIEKKYKRDLEHLELREYFENHVGERTKPSSFYVPDYKEFLPSATFNADYPRNLDYPALFKLLEEYPPFENWWILKDSCTAIRVESCTSQNDRDEKGSMLSSVICKVEHSDGYGTTCNFEWSSKVGEKHFEINVKVNAYPVFFIDIKSKRTKTGKIDYIISTDLTSKIPRDKYTFIKWAAGSNDYPNSFTVMFQPWQKLPEIIELLKTALNNKE